MTKNNEERKKVFLIGLNRNYFFIIFYMIILRHNKIYFLSNKGTKIIILILIQYWFQKWIQGARNSYKLYKTIKMPLKGMLLFPCGSNHSTSIHLIFSEHSQCSTYKRLWVYIPVLITCRCDKNPLLLSRYKKVITLKATCFMHNYQVQKGGRWSGGKQATKSKAWPKCDAWARDENYIKSEGGWQIFLAETQPTSTK